MSSAQPQMNITSFTCKLTNSTLSCQMQQQSLLLQIKNQQSHYILTIDQQYLTQQGSFFRSVFQYPVDIFHYLIGCYQNISITDAVLQFNYQYGGKVKKVKKIRLPLGQGTQGCREERGRTKIEEQFANRDRRIEILQQNYRDLHTHQQTIHSTLSERILQLQRKSQWKKQQLTKINIKQGQYEQLNADIIQTIKLIEKQMEQKEGDTSIPLEIIELSQEKNKKLHQLLQYYDNRTNSILERMQEIEQRQSKTQKQSSFIVQQIKGVEQFGPFLQHYQNQSIGIHIALQQIQKIQQSFSLTLKQVMNNESINKIQQQVDLLKTELATAVKKLQNKFDQQTSLNLQHYQNKTDELQKRLSQTNNRLLSLQLQKREQIKKTKHMKHMRTYSEFDSTSKTLNTPKRGQSINQQFCANPNVQQQTNPCFPIIDIQSKINSLQQKVQQNQHQLLQNYISPLQTEVQKNYMELTLALKQTEQKVPQLEQRINNLTQILLTYPNKFQSLIQLLSTLQQKLDFHSEQLGNTIGHHHLNLHQQKYYTLTTLTSHSFSLIRSNEYGWFNFMNRSQILPNKKVRYSIKRCRITKNSLMIGVCTQKSIGRVNNHEGEESAYYNCAGMLYYNKQFKFKDVPSTQAEVIEFLVDLTNWKLIFSSKGKEFIQCSLPQNMRNKVLYLGIMMQWRGDQIKIQI